MKRLTYILVFLGVLALGAIVGLFFYYRSQTSSPAPAATASPAAQTGNLPSVATNSAGSAGGAPSGQTGQGTPAAVVVAPHLTILAQNPVAAFYANASGTVLIAEPGGKIAQVFPGGTTNILNPTPIAGLRRLSFSQDGAKALALFGDAENPQASVFDVASKSWSPLPARFRAAAWAPTGDVLAYLAEHPDAPGMLTLSTLDTAAASANPQPLFSFHATDLSLAWPAPNELTLTGAPSGLATSPLFSFDMKKKTLALLSADNAGLTLRWGNPAIPLGLAFRAGDGGRGGALSLIGLDGTVFHALSFLTLPEKCAFSFDNLLPATSTPAALFGTASSTDATATSQNAFLYCAVPRDQAALESNILPDAYNEHALPTADDLYAVDLRTGNIALLFASASPALDADHFLVAGRTLYFVNRYDQKLYALTPGR